MENREIEKEPDIPELSDEEIDKTRKIDDNTILDYDKNGQLVGIEILFAQDAVNRLGHGRAFARAETLLAKMARHHHVGGVFKSEDLLEKRGTTVE